MASRNFTYIYGQRNSRKLQHDSFLYYKHKETPEQTSFRCELSRRKTYTCKASGVLVGNTFTLTKPHQHPGDMAKVEVERIKSFIYENAARSSDNAKTIIGNALANVEPETTTLLPSNKSIMRTICRKRKAIESDGWRAVSPFEDPEVPFVEDQIEEPSPFMKALGLFNKPQNKIKVSKSDNGLEPIGKIKRGQLEKFPSKVMIVSNLKMFQCLANGTCMKTFSNTKNLNMHQLTHVTDNYYCLKCHQLFNRCCNCRRHQLKCKGTKSEEDELDMVKYLIHNNKKMFSNIL
uniref:C2H2-type domain-containing protein n=1 Tax=Rhabditophanes sp. KR3021 TaxID=114890 RepID=A0AC35UCQ2_9BILA